MEFCVGFRKLRNKGDFGEFSREHESTDPPRGLDQLSDSSKFDDKF